ncbi:unnamed protein product, partial [Rotaria sp. Silwood1]
VTTQNYSLSRCICHERSPYRPGEKWALQKALIYAAHMFIDKSSTVNNWAAGLTSNNSTLSYGRRKRMINYAIYDCFSTTYIIRPVLEYWTFKQLNDINIVELFTSFEALPLPKINASNKKSKKIKKNINLQKLFNLNVDDLQPISDDEIYLNRLIEPVTNKQFEHEETSTAEQKLNDNLMVNNNELIINEDDQLITGDDEDNELIIDIDDNNELILDNNNEDQSAKEKPTTSKHKPHRLRSQASRQQRNKKRNNTHRMRRYQHRITRSIYYKFKESFVKKILKQHDFKYVHVKVVDGTLFIGVKNNMIKQKYQDQIPEDMFDRKHYHQYRHQHHHQNRHQYHLQHSHQHHHE